MSKPQTMDEYVERYVGQARETLDQLHALAGEAVPDANVAIKWGHPAWVHPSGTILFVISGHAKHANFTLTPSSRKAFDAELDGFDTGKGAVTLPYGTPVPRDLLRRMIAYRIREHQEDGVLWM
ncbi:iron chaperone [Streptomyces sp. NPDC005227]|uniref:iron chaperone n=1 Tax=Streptomyces sp. NPDC005227 TaxID=3364707 RepID=UPI0036A8603B